ncbi:hypothetical protein L798_15554 [Zootermopsis nevadensis]|uniref:Uncharacterized protein n=1 Tax=Zootermopsis nevadensis TaxID=136037 RepID=A0A067QWN5_ZOONE|nr:hypothetical protein L798_15554 [Zootermopsis nevadensis]
MYSRKIKSVTEVCTYSHLSTATTKHFMSLFSAHTHTHTLCPPSLSGPSSSALFTLFAYTSARSTPLDTRWLLGRHGPRTRFLFTRPTCLYSASARSTPLDTRWLLGRHGPRTRCLLT